jgi:SAM-dependent methyltransferase
VTNPAVAYHEYLGPAIFAPSTKLTLEAARIQPHERVLDVACGTGILTTQVRAARIAGLDVNPRMLAIARTNPGEWVEASALAIPFGAEFDVVLCQHGLQFFPDRLAGAREMRRVAGRAIVQCWQGVDEQGVFGSIVRAQAKLLGLPVAQVGVPFSFGDPGALREVLREAGFANVEVETYVIDARFREAEQMIPMFTRAAMAVMPERFGHIDPAAFNAAMRAECGSELARHTDGDTLRFPMPTNVARAW